MRGRVNLYDVYMYTYDICVYAEPESPNAGVCLKIKYDEPESPNEGGVSKIYDEPFRYRKPP